MRTYCYNHPSGNTQTNNHHRRLVSCRFTSPVLGLLLMLLGCVVPFLPTCHGLATLPPIGRLCFYRSEALQEFFELQEHMQSLMQKRLELGAALFEQPQQPQQELPERPSLWSLVCSDDNEDDKDRIEAWGNALLQRALAKYRIRVGNNSTRLQEFLETDHALHHHCIALAEFCHVENCTDFQVLENMYEHWDVYQYIQERAQQAKDIYLPILQHQMETERYFQDLEQRLLLVDESTSTSSSTSSTNSADSTKKHLLSLTGLPRKTRIVRRAEKTLAQWNKKQKATTAAASNVKVPVQHISPLSSSPPPPSSSFTKFDEPYFKAGALEQSSEQVVEEYNDLMEDHEYLIVEKGPDYGELPPLEKLVFLDDMMQIKERWDIFFMRAKLMGAINPKRQDENEIFLHYQQMSEDDYRTLHTWALQRMRDDATQELLALHDEERLDPSKIPRTLQSSSSSSSSSSMMDWSSQQQQQQQRRNHQNQEDGRRPSLRSLPRRLLNFLRIPF